MVLLGWGEMFEIRFPVSRKTSLNLTCPVACVHYEFTNGFQNSRDWTNVLCVQRILRKVTVARLFNLVFIFIFIPFRFLSLLSSLHNLHVTVVFTTTLQYIACRAQMEQFRNGTVGVTSQTHGTDYINYALWHMLHVGVSFVSRYGLHLGYLD